MSIAKQMKGFYALVIAVNNLDEAIKSYQSLGFEMSNRSPREAWGLEAAQFKVGDSVIELLTPVADDKPVAQTVRKFLDKNGEGVYQVAVRVDNVDTVYKFLKETGTVRLVGEPHARPLNPDKKLMWVSPKSTHGVFLEFLD